MRRFYLDRRADPTGISGTGIVAEGVEFADGTVVVRWLGMTPTTTIHQNMVSVERVHCHVGDTVVRWREGD